MKTHCVLFGVGTELLKVVMGQV